jgi:hypothetical protein
VLRVAIRRCVMCDRWVCRTDEAGRFWHLQGDLSPIPVATRADCCRACRFWTARTRE